MAFETFAVHAACIRGVEAIHVTVEVSLAGGVPGIQMLGIPSMEVMESRGRIRCAMRSAGFEIPRSPSSARARPRRMVLPWQSLRQRWRLRRE